MTEETRITGGSVMFEDAVKIDVGGDPQFWPTKRARVELSFVVGPDDDGDVVADHTIVAAQAKVGHMLGRSATDAPAAQVKPKGTRAATKAKEAEDAAKNAIANAETAAKLTAALAKDDPSAIVDDEIVLGEPEKAGAEQIGNAGVAQTSADPSAIVDEEWSTPPAEVTDADLNAAVSKKNEAIKDPPRIRALIATFNPDPSKVFQLREIAQGRRAEFLDKLEALKGA